MKKTVGNRGDGLGRLTQSVDPRTGTSTTAYYSVNDAVGSRGQVASQSNPAGNAISYTYDSSTGRLSSSRDPLNQTEYYAYTTRGELYRQWGATAYPVQYSYNEYGECTTMSTFRGGSSWDQATWPASPGNADTTTWNYDVPTGLLLSKTDAANHAVNYTYTARGQLHTRTWARNVTATYVYDSATAEETGITYSDGTPSLSYTYNRLGQTATVGDATGSRSFAYSPTTTQLSSETLDGTFYSGRILTRDYDTTTTGAIGRSIGYRLGTSGAPSCDQDIDYGYDAYGRFNGLTQSNYGIGFSYAYTANSNLIGSVTQGSYQQTLTYESQRDHLSSLETDFGSTNVARMAYTVDALGRRTTAVQTGAVFSRYTEGALAQRFGYNGRSELTSTATSYGQNPDDTGKRLSGRQYGYAFDNIGNRTSSSVDSRSVTYTNNALNQVTSRTTPSSVDVTGEAPTAASVTVNGQGTTRQGDYFYKNLSTATPPLWMSLSISSSYGGSETRYAFLPSNPEGYSYDADGNLLQDGRWAYTWDAENRLTSMECIYAAYVVGTPRQRMEFSYDYLGRRVEKRVYSWNLGTGLWDLTARKRFLYDGWNLTAEYNALSGFTLIRSYTWGLDIAVTVSDTGGVRGLLLVTDIASGTQYLPAYDGNGNILALINRATGKMDAVYEYSPFGETIRATGSYAASNPFRFSTRYTDTETGLVYYGFRYYQPDLGRWLGRDPIEEKGGLNLYAFVRNNPVNAWDVLGQDTLLDTNPYGQIFEREDGTDYFRKPDGTTAEVGRNYGRDSGDTTLGYMSLPDAVDIQYANQQLYDQAGQAWIAEQAARSTMLDKEPRGVVAVFGGVQKSDYASHLNTGAESPHESESSIEDGLLGGSTMELNPMSFSPGWPSGGFHPGGVPIISAGPANKQTKTDGTGIAPKEKAPNSTAGNGGGILQGLKFWNWTAPSLSLSDIAKLNASTQGQGWIDPKLSDQNTFDTTTLGSFSLNNIFNGNIESYFESAAETALVKGSLLLAGRYIAADLAALGAKGLGGVGTGLTFVATANDLINAAARDQANRIPRSSTAPADGGGTYVGDGIIVTNPSDWFGP